jgi:hypothetical protein
VNGPSPRLTRRVVPVVLGLVVAALYVPPLASAGLRTDLGGQLLHTQLLDLSGSSFAPYYLLFQATIIIRVLIPVPALALLIPEVSGRQATWEIAGVVTIAGSVVLAAEVIYFRLLAMAGARDARGYGWSQAAASMGLMLIAPITFFTWSNHQLLVGYVPFTLFDGSTTVFLKPFALLLFWFVVDRMDAESTPTRDIWICAALSVLAWSAKPSFTVCLAPALVVYVVVRALRRRAVAWRFLAAGFFVSTALVAVPLTAAAVKAAGPHGSPGFALAPLKNIGDALAVRGQPLWVFAPLLVASCAFPLAVAIAYRRRVAASSSLVLAWLVFAAGAGQYYLFRITQKVDFGDLIGGAQIGLFLVYVESVRFAFDEERRMATPTRGGDGQRLRLTRRSVLAGLFALQIVCGVVLLVKDVRDPAAWW